MLAVGFSMLIIGTLANSRSRKSCGMLGHRSLSRGGIMCFIHGLFTVPYYVSATATRREEEKMKENANQSVRRTWSSFVTKIRSYYTKINSYTKCTFILFHFFVFYWLQRWLDFLNWCTNIYEWNHKIKFIL